VRSVVGSLVLCRTNSSPDARRRRPAPDRFRSARRLRPSTAYIVSRRRNRTIGLNEEPGCRSAEGAVELGYGRTRKPHDIASTRAGPTESIRDHRAGDPSGYWRNRNGTRPVCPLWRTGDRHRSNSRPDLELRTASASCRVATGRGLLPNRTPSSVTSQVGRPCSRAAESRRAGKTIVRLVAESPDDRIRHGETSEERPDIASVTPQSARDTDMAGSTAPQPWLSSKFPRPAAIVCAPSPAASDRAWSLPPSRIHRVSFRRALENDRA